MTEEKKMDAEQFQKALDSVEFETIFEEMLGDRGPMDGTDYQIIQILRKMARSFDQCADRIQENKTS